MRDASGERYAPMNDEGGGALKSSNKTMYEMDIDNSQVATSPAAMVVLPGTMEESLLDLK